MHTESDFRDTAEPASKARPVAAHVKMLAKGGCVPHLVLLAKRRR